MTAVISLESLGERTKYTALVIHGDEDARARHEQVGFHNGWGKALDQLVAVAHKMAYVATSVNSSCGSRMPRSA